MLKRGTFQIEKHLFVNFTKNEKYDKNLSKKCIHVLGYYAIQWIQYSPKCLTCVSLFYSGLKCKETCKILEGERDKQYFRQLMRFWYLYHIISFIAPF